MNKTRLFSIILLFPAIGFGWVSDLNRDGIVDLQDFAIFSSQWLKEETMTTKYAQFDGVSGHITVPDHPVLKVGTNDFSVFFKVIIEHDSTSGIAYLFSKCFEGLSQRQHDGFYCGMVKDDIVNVPHIGNMVVHNGFLVLFFQDAYADTGYQFNGSRKIDDGIEHSICITVNRNQAIRLYIDGVLDIEYPIDEDQYPLNYSQYPSDLLLGSFAGAHSPEKIADFQLYNGQALSPGDVENLCLGKTISIVPSWRIDLSTVDGDLIRGVKANGFELNATKNSGVSIISVENQSTITGLVIADQVVNCLNSDEYNLPFTAQRKLLPVYDIQELSTLRVTVLPKEVAVTPLCRSVNQLDYQIDIAIQQVLESTESNRANALMDLAIQMANRFKNKILCDGKALCCKQTIQPLYSAEHIQPPSVFTSIVTLNFKVFS